jgi:hypothetical protein
MALLVVEDGRILSDTGGIIPRLLDALQTLDDLQRQIAAEHAAYLTIVQDHLQELTAWATTSHDAPAIQATIDRLHDQTVATEALALQVQAVTHAAENEGV